MTVWLQIWGLILHGLFGQALPFPGPGAGGVPPPPLSGMQVWYEADVGNNCGGGACTDGANQDSWADQSGNGKNGVANGTAAIASGQPNCIAGVYHTNQINGKPAVTFNGNATTPTCFASTPLINLAATGASVFVVMKKTTACTGGGSNNLGCSLMGGGGSSLNWSAGSGASGVGAPGGAKACVASIGSATTTTGTSWVQMNFTYATPNYAFRIARAATGSGSNAQTISTTSGYFGMGGNGCSGTNLDPFNGQIAEWILYNRVLSGAEITTVETYLNSKYGL